MGRIGTVTKVPSEKSASLVGSGWLSGQVALFPSSHWLPASGELTFPTSLAPSSADSPGGSHRAGKAARSVSIS